MNLPTSYDFLVIFAFGHFAADEAREVTARALLWLYYVALNYESGRKRQPSAVALAALCYVT